MAPTDARSLSLSIHCGYHQTSIFELTLTSDSRHNRVFKYDNSIVKCALCWTNYQPCPSCICMVPILFPDTLMFRVFYWVFMLSLSINFRLLNGSDSVCTCCLGGAGLAKVGYKNKYYYGWMEPHEKKSIFHSSPPVEPWLCYPYTAL